jgi:hypothetical protein
MVANSNKAPVTKVFPIPPTNGAFTDDLVGRVLDYERGGIDDDGGYGDPHTDDTPDFIKRDAGGWIPLLRWRKQR